MDRAIQGYIINSEPHQARISRRRQLLAAEVIDRVLALSGQVRPLVLISGFWRSGTTWLQECMAESLAAKTVFEPLSPMIPARKAALAAAGFSTDAVREGVFPAPTGDDDPLWSYLDKALLGVGPGEFGLTCRRTISESFRTPVVIKDVRLQFNLSGVHERYGLPVVHLRRRPTAAVASLVRRNWYWSFDDLRLAETLPHMREELAPFDTDALSRASACWAVTERQVAADIAGRPWAVTVQYEEARAHADATIARLCQFIGQRRRRAMNVAAPSASDWGTDVDPDAAPEAPASIAQAAATNAEADRIIEVVTALFPAFDGPL